MTMENVCKLSIRELIDKLDNGTLRNVAGPLGNRVEWLEIKRRLLENHILVHMIWDVRRFNEEIIGLPISDPPARLDVRRKQHACDHLQEELNEFGLATTLMDEVDALIDLAYVALGRIVEMGLSPLPLFDMVHAANMRRVRGSNATRPNATGFDAVKPEGWEAPDLAPYLTATKRELDRLLEQKTLADHHHPVEDTETRQPKILVLGYARHGKDMVCELLHDMHGFRFTSSSKFCASRVLWPLIIDQGSMQAIFINSFKNVSQQIVRRNQLQKMYSEYKTPFDCYEDRGSFRNLWYDAISWYNSPDKTRLAREMLKFNDVYCGMRASDEFHACRNEGVFDAVIWVDASLRGVPVESRSSCTVEPWMSDYVVDNNRTIEDLRRNLKPIVTAIRRHIENADGLIRLASMEGSV